MGAYYDNYDYSSYWKERDYEHESEVLCIKAYLDKIPKINKALEIGGGFGRLVPSYAYRARKVFLTDPSGSLLSQAKKKLQSNKNIEYVQSRLENLPNKFHAKSFDLVVMIRVMHHLEKPDEAFKVIDKLTASDGYLILEFANKIHFKNVISELAKGNFRFMFDKKTIDIRSEKSKKAKTIPFLNYHPSVIKDELSKNNFEIIETRSVSNIRSPFLKKHLPKDILLGIEKYIQKPLAHIYFGPSTFILARKRG